MELEVNHRSEDLTHPTSLSNLARNRVGPARSGDVSYAVNCKARHDL